MTAIGTDSQVRLNLEHLVGSFPTYANDPPVLLDEISNLGLHLQVKRRIELPDKLLFAIGLALPGRALLETIGRKTGKPRRTPVGDGLVGNQFWIVAEHGMRADYVRNIQTNPRVRLKLREGVRFAGITARHICSRKMIPGSASGGLLLNCRAALRMQASCASLELNCLRCGLIWMADSR